MGRTVALANQKGGVGKTTTAVNLACYLAGLGHQVLLVDLDPQGNATSSVGVDKRSLGSTTYDVLLNDADVESAVIQQVRPNLDLLPANKELAGAEVELQSLTRPQRRLQAALEAVKGRYDAIIVDCPPSLGLLTINGLTASEGVVIPVQCEYLALEGLAEITNTIDLVQRSLNPSLQILGVVMTMYDARTNLASDVVRNVQHLFPNRTFRTQIPRLVRIAEAPSHGKSIFEYDAGSRAAETYQSLGSEIVDRLELEPPAAGENGARRRNKYLELLRRVTVER